MAVQARAAPGVQLEVWRQHWQDEGDAAFLYRRIAAAEVDRGRTRIFTDLAAVEDRHVARWAEILREAGVALPPFRPSLRARTLALVGRVFGWKLLASILLAEEGREMKGYLRGARSYADERAALVAADLARESAAHAEQLGSLLGITGEPWHRIESGGFLRNAVYGFNDRLTANFGLVMGVLGASVPHHIILVSGAAGLMADALSMGSSGYLASMSEREVHAHEIAVEREELRLMPEVEEAELVLLYQTRGMSPEAARQAAREVISQPERALQEKTSCEPARQGMDYESGHIIQGIARAEIKF